MAWFKKKTEKKPDAETTDPMKPSGHPEHAKTAETAATESETAVQQTSEKPKPKGLFERLRKGLSKTREILTTDIEDLFAGRNRLDAALLDQIEELLITSDIGVQTTTQLMETISKRSKDIRTPSDLKSLLKDEITRMMGEIVSPPALSEPRPRVIMVIGVNGVGKTTTIGKLAHNFRTAGKSVLIAAADTFRAAAVEQLAIWSERAGAEIIRHRENADPAAVAYDGVEAAAARGRDIVMVDTAGRLHTKKNLMEELKKIKRAIQKKIPDAPHEVLLVLDATTGQNAISQARLFTESLGVTGLVLTKLDGSAKGGVVIRICTELSLPIRFVGVGEGIDDLQTFDPRHFAEALFS